MKVPVVDKTTRRLSRIKRLESCITKLSKRNTIAYKDVKEISEDSGGDSKQPERLDENLIVDFKQKVTIDSVEPPPPSNNDDEMRNIFSDLISEKTLSDFLDNLPDLQMMSEGGKLPELKSICEDILPTDKLLYPDLYDLMKLPIPDDRTLMPPPDVFMEQSNEKPEISSATETSKFSRERLTFQELVEREFKKIGGQKDQNGSMPPVLFNRGEFFNFEKILRDLCWQAYLAGFNYCMEDCIRRICRVDNLAPEKIEIGLDEFLCKDEYKITDFSREKK